MKCFITFTFAVVAAVGIAATAWSQAGQSGGAGTAGTAGAGGTTGPATTPGAAATPTPGTATTPGAAGTVGVAGGAGAAGSATVGQNPNSGNAGINMNGNVRQTPFFSDRGVRQQLNMQDNQFNTLNRAYQNAYGRYSQGLNNLNANLTPQQRMQRMQELENQFNSEFGRSVDSMFSDPRYRSRYDQLNRQYMGFNAFNDRAIQRQMNLTPEQMQQVRLMSAEWRKQLAQLRGNGSVTPQEWNQVYSQYWNQLNSMLTPEQQRIWLQLTGERYTFPPNLYYPPATGARVGANAGVDPRIDIPYNSTPQGTNANAPQGVTR